MLERVVITAELDRATECRIEFPSLEIGRAGGSRVAIRREEWRNPACDLYELDARMAVIQREDAALELDTGEIALEVLTRYQRMIPRRNRWSRGSAFERALEMHRQLHQLDKPLVRADYDHALDVWHWLLRLEPEASEPLQLAALFHDIERLVSEPEVRIEQHAPDYQAFKDEHAQLGAHLTARVLEDAGVRREVVEEVKRLIEQHERRSIGENTLQDADALSFFSLNSPGFVDYYGPEHARKKVSWTLERMSPRARARLSRVRLRGDVESMVRP